jgi:hypothetical protein
MRRAALLLVVLLGSCVGSGRGPVLPRATEAPGRRETQECFADLSRMGVKFTPLPDHDYGGGCRIEGAVKLVDIGVPVGGLGAMRCGAARQFVGWTQHALAPAAYQMLGSELKRVDTYGTYACRNVIGNAASASRLSGHAIANAVDFAGVTLADGRRVTVERDWNGPDERARGFLRTVRASACKRFGTVLSPDYNAAHHNHLHLEDDRAGFCR